MQGLRIKELVPDSVTLTPRLLSMFYIDRAFY